MELFSIDPATYGVDAMRITMLGIGRNSFALDMVALLGFAISFGVIGAYSFARMKAV
jgi:ABC-type multidrug transport system permease subunit